MGFLSDSIAVKRRQLEQYAAILHRNLVISFERRRRTNTSVPLIVDGFMIESQVNFPEEPRWKAQLLLRRLIRDQVLILPASACQCAQIWIFDSCCLPSIGVEPYMYIGSLFPRSQLLKLYIITHPSCSSSSRNNGEQFSRHAIRQLGVRSNRL